MTFIGQHVTTSRASHPRLRPWHWFFASAAIVATLTTVNATPPGNTDSVVAAGPSATAPLPIDDTNFVNDQGQTSGDTFTQNAQDQSTAGGAGTP